MLKETDKKKDKLSLESILIIIALLCCVLVMIPFGIKYSELKKMKV